MNDILERFKSPEIAADLAKKLGERKGKNIKIMELCGTHTMAIYKSGIRELLPKSIKLVAGPGCPVCVTPNYFVDAAIKLSKMKDVMIATFGDMMRVPGNNGSLIEAKAQGGNIKVVYSPLDCIEISKNNPDLKIVFLSIGFETTTPIIALAVKKAKELGLHNFYVLAANKTMPVAVSILAEDKNLKIDGFLYPGHVSVIAGTKYCEDISLKYKIPGVVAGFEPVDLLFAISELTEKIDNKDFVVNNLYSRAVNKNGNEEALSTLYEVFEAAKANWRGIGMIEGSGLSIRREFEEFDAWKVFDLEQKYEEVVNGCICGEVLKGVKEPCDCPLFGKVCIPENPKGACMVSSEGACAAYYKYGRI